MHLLSLTTDYGTSEYYLAYLKAKLLAQVPQLQMLDVSHDIPMEDLGMAAYQLRAAIPAFPPNAIHLVCVNEFLFPDLGVLIARKKDQWIVAPNNGFLHLLYDDYDYGPVTHIGGTGSAQRSDAIAQIVYGLCHQYGYIESLREPAQYITKYNINPIVSPDQIRTRIYHIDHFGNIILNVHRELFDKVRDERDFAVEFRKFTYDDGLKDHLAQVEIGELACSFNHGNHMVISAYQDRAVDLLDVRKEETVNISFTPTTP